MENKLFASFVQLSSDIHMLSVISKAMLFLYKDNDIEQEKYT